MMLLMRSTLDTESEVNGMRGNGRGGFVKIVMNINNGLFCVTG